MPKLIPTSATVSGLAVLALAGTASADPAYPTGASPAVPTANPVVEWNRTLLGILRTPGAQPATVHPTRSLALLQAAIYDAVVSIDRRAPAYRVFISAPRRASRSAAADAAAATVLDALSTSKSSTTDAQLRQDLAALGGGGRVQDGARVGRVVAKLLLALRANDGSAATPPTCVSTGEAGDFAPPPPALAAPVFTHWANVKPFVLPSGNELRPAAPSPLTSTASTAALREVESLGSATSTTRTADQTQIARFWAAPIQNYWNEIAQSAALAKHADLDTSARAFALLDLAQADTTIAFYDATSSPPRSAASRSPPDHSRASSSANTPPAVRVHGIRIPPRHRPHPRLRRPCHHLARDVRGEGGARPASAHRRPPADGGMSPQDPQGGP